MPARPERRLEQPWCCCLAAAAGGVQAGELGLGGSEGELRQRQAGARVEAARPEAAGQERRRNRRDRGTVARLGDHHPVAATRALLGVAAEDADDHATPVAAERLQHRRDAVERPGKPGEIRQPPCPPQPGQRRQPVMQKAKLQPGEEQDRAGAEPARKRHQVGGADGCRRATEPGVGRELAAADPAGRHAPAPAWPRIAATSERPRGARFPGRMALTTRPISDRPSAPQAAAAEDRPGTEEAPEMAVSPAARADASRLAMPWANAASSERSRYCARQPAPTGPRDEDRPP